MRTLWRLCHRALTLLLTLIVLASIGLGGVAWRLSQGPLDVSWLARRVAGALDTPDVAGQISVQAVELAWEGWRLGLGHPLDLRLTGITAANPDGSLRARIPAARVSMSFGWLLLGQLVPRAIEIDGAQLRIVRGSEGRLDLDIGGPDSAEPTGVNPFDTLLSEIRRPERTDRGADFTRWGQLNRVRLSRASIVVIDRALGVTWQAPDATIDLQRRAEGGMNGTADITLALAGQSVQVSAEASLAATGTTTVHLRVSPLAPAAFAEVLPSLAPLAAVEAPIGGELDLVLDRDLKPGHITLHASMGAGRIRVAAGSLAIQSATLQAAGDLQNFDIQRLSIALAARDGRRGPTLQLHGRVTGLSEATVAIDVDQLAFADLAQYWPSGTDHGARAWITANITAGTIRSAHVTLGLSLRDASDIALTAASGQVVADDLTLAWLRPIPPIEHAQASLTILSPDALQITFQGGRQAGGGLAVSGGGMRISGLQDHDQLGAIDLAIAGPLADTLALLRQPRLGLLSRHPIELRDPGGQVALKLTVTLPLRREVGVDQVGIHAQGQLREVHLGAILAGRDLDGGSFAIDAGNDGLRLDGTMALAAISAELGVQMDFRAGPPQQVLQHLAVTASATAAQLAAIGLAAGGAVSGSTTLHATLAEHRDGTGEAIVEADLLRAGLTAAPLGWTKPQGSPANGSLRLHLDHDRITAADRIVVQGDGLAVRGQAEFSNGTPTLLHLDQIDIGRTRASGDVGFSPLRLSVSGATLDLSAPARSGEQPPGPPGPAWIADASFDSIILGPDRTLSAVAAHAENDGRVFRQAQLAGLAGAGSPFRIAIRPDPAVPTGRLLTGQAGDAGALFKAMNLTRSVQGGTLTLTGRYDDSLADHPLSATAELDDFRLTDAPFAARVLQAMTVYGVADLIGGAGLGITQMVVPFNLAGKTLNLLQARAFSPSLGFTVRGRVDLGQRRLDLQGTIVPAYFFNTMLGNLPLVGRLFSPEQGGGVFAATYAVAGPIDDPSVSVNPLAALTPGFLRGLFGLFEK